MSDSGWSRMDFDPEFRANYEDHMAREEYGQGRHLPHPSMEGEMLWLCDVGREGCPFCDFVWTKAS